MIATRWGRVFAALAAVIAFGVYWLTLAHTITWRHNGADGGDLVTAAFVYGIPHPPGYPLYTLIAFFFARNPFVEPAQGVAAFSTLAMAMTVFMLARTGAALLPETLVTESAGKRGSAKETGIGALVLVPPIAALVFAFAPLVWSQAIIPEVYALNLLLVAVILWTCLTDARRRVGIAALALGLGMTHHLSILLLLPGALIALRPTLKNWGALILLFAPLVLYAYLPFAALPNPPVKWGDPVTPDRFIWLVTAQLYRPYFFAVSSSDVLSRLAFAARALVDQFTIAGLALIVWGAIQMAMTRGRSFLALVVMFVPVVAYALLYASRDSFLYLLPGFAIAWVWMVYGVVQVLGLAGDDRLLRVAGVALFALLPIYSVVANYAVMDVSQDRAAFEYARRNFDGLSEDAVLFADGDESLFSIWYYRHAIAYANARSVIVSQSLLQYDWYYDGLRRTMSEVQFAPPTEVADAHARAKEIIRVTFAEGRAVCFTDSSPLLPEFEYEERGVLKCVVAERAG